MDDLPQGERLEKKEYVQALASRDFQGVRECDVFILLSEPVEGRSMYVELGLALSMHEATGRPQVFVVGATNDQSIFYFHPAVRCLRTLDEVLVVCAEPASTVTNVVTHQNRLEEYKALRAEMLEIIKDRIWGQATFAVLSAGLLALTSSTYKLPSLIFMIGLAVPFLYHTIFREHARIRMGNYLRVVLEPRLPGLFWEEYLGIWRSKFGRKPGQGWLSIVDRMRHIFALSGLYFLTSWFCWILLLNTTEEFIPRAIGSSFLVWLLLTYRRFFKLYDLGSHEYDELRKMNIPG